MHENVLYQHREIIQLKDVIWDSRVFQTVGSGYHRLYMTGSHVSTTDLDPNFPDY